VVVTAEAVSTMIDLVTTTMMTETTMVETEMAMVVEDVEAEVSEVETTGMGMITVLNTDNTMIVDLHQDNLIVTMTDMTTVAGEEVLAMTTVTTRVLLGVTEMVVAMTHTVIKTAATFKAGSSPGRDSEADLHKTTTLTGHHLAT